MALYQPSPQATAKMPLFANLRLYFCACTVVSETLYHFGGRNGRFYYNVLRTLNRVTLHWEELHQIDGDQPMPKSACGIAPYHDKVLGTTSLAVFAGYGRPNNYPTKAKERFVQHRKFSDGRGWTNEFHLFNLKNREWSSPPTTGPCPPPCSFFSFTSINNHMAVMFGGYQPRRRKGRRRVNDVYIIDFQSMKWTKLKKPKGAPWPVERELHAACCLNYNDEHPQLLVTGGMDNNRNTLKDAWILDVNSGKWKELALPEGTGGHTSRHVCSDLIQPITLGDLPQFEPGNSPGHDDHQRVAETTVMEFKSVQSLSSSDDHLTREWEAVGSNEPGSEARTSKLKPKIAEYGYLRGVEVIDRISFTFTTRAQSIEWLNHGFKIHFPENALPPGVNECRVHVKASLSGQFQFPEDTVLTSGIYWIASPYTFEKPVTVEVQHCVTKPEHLQQPSNFTFIVAKCTQEELPYQFKTLDGGVFCPSSRYGSIKLTQFSGIGTAFQSTRRQSLMQRLGLRTRQHAKTYCARLYYSRTGTNSWDIYFAITWNLELHITAIDANYTDAAAKAGPSQVVMFEGDEIKLDIAAEGVDLENGWTITPYTHPGISKDQVDHFVPGSQLPSCQLYVEWAGQQEQPVQLLHRVKLLGAKDPNNFFLIRLPTPQALPEVVALRMSSVEQSLGSKYLGLESEPQLSDLMNEVASKVSTKWREISIQLGLTLNDQKYFMELTLGDPKQCFTFVFTVWKSRATKPYTWSTVIKALETPAVDEIRLAQELRMKLQS